MGIIINFWNAQFKRSLITLLQAHTLVREYHKPLLPQQIKLHSRSFFPLLHLNTFYRI